MRAQSSVTAAGPHCRLARSGQCNHAIWRPAGSDTHGSSLRRQAATGQLTALFAQRCSGTLLVVELDLHALGTSKAHLIEVEITQAEHHPDSKPEQVSAVAHRRLEYRWH